MSIKRFYFVLLLIGTTVSVSAYEDHRNVRIDSLETVLKSSNPPKGENLLRVYDELVRGYQPFNSKKCEEYARKALALSYEVNGLNARQHMLRHLGLLRYGREEFDEALDYFQQALAVTDTMATQKRYTQKALDDARSAIYGSIANAYNLQDKAHLAIHYYQLALPIFERNGWLESQTILYHNIGELYLQMGNNAEAERNYILAVEKAEQSGDSLLMALPRKGLAKVYIGQNNYGKALQTAEAAYTYYKNHNDEEPHDYAETLASLTRIHMMEGHQDIAKAQAYAQEALTCINDDMMFETQADVYSANCEVAIAQQQWQQALDYGLRSIHPDSAATTSDKDCYMLLAQIYTELGQKEKAREYYNKVYDMMNRYATDHYQSGLSQMEVLYETEKKEAQITALHKERSLYFWLLAAAIGLIALLVVLLVYRYLAHRRQKALLAAKVALEAETKERRILARDLHDGLGGMLSVLRLKISQPPSSPHEGETLKLLDDIIAELRRTAHHLMPDELLRKGLVSALNDFTASIPNATFQAIGDVQLDKEIELVLYRCAYELVSNALKHAHAGHINIQLMQEPKHVTLTVSDDGNGMAPGIGDDNPQTTGMGLQNIRERIDPYKGRLDIVTANGNGTDINIILSL